MDRDTVTTLLLDLLARTALTLPRLRELSPAELNSHPGGHPNSPAWLLWHTGREIDMQLAHLSGDAEVWEEFRERVGLGEIGDTLGYGHSNSEAASVQVEDFTVLIEYIGATLGAAHQYISGVSDWGEIIDTYDGEPITRHVRVTSILIDAIEHLAQVAYIAGMPSVLP